MTKKVKKNNTPKERVEEFLQECELYEEETNGLAEELPCYKRLVRDLEVLEILKNHIYIDNDTAVDNFSMQFHHTAYNGTEFNKVKEWLDENKTN